MRREGKGRDGKGWKGMERDRKGWEGIERDGKGWEWMGRDGTSPPTNLPPHQLPLLLNLPRITPH